LADLALLNAQDLTDVIGAYKKRPEGTQVLIPTVGDLPGNPVMFSQEVRQAVLNDGAHVGCKQWQAAHPEAVHRWATENRRYRLDIDAPEDIEALARTSGHQLRWPAAYAIDPTAA
jgi:molybdenum cofactor cytidylyltransferase